MQLNVFRPFIETILNVHFISIIGTDILLLRYRFEQNKILSIIKFYISTMIKLFPMIVSLGDGAYV